MGRLGRLGGSDWDGLYMFINWRQHHKNKATSMKLSEAEMAHKFISWFFQPMFVHPVYPD